MGANTLTIATGHVIDALRFVAGDFKRVACMVSTQVPQWYQTDTQQYVDTASPDNVRVSGQLERGAAASVHVGAVPWAGTGYRMEIFGREGTLVVTGNVSSQRGEMLRVQGAQGSHQLEDLDIPNRFVYVPDDFPRATHSTSASYMPSSPRQSGPARADCPHSTPPLASTASWIPSSGRPTPGRSRPSPETTAGQ